MKPQHVQEREVEVSSASCSGAEVVVRVTCKCGINKEFSFDHRPWSTSFPIHPHHQFRPLSDRIAPFLFWQFTGVWTEYRTRLTVLGSENHGPRRNCLQSQRAVGMLDCTYSFVWTLMNVWCFQACRTMLLGCFGLWDVVNHNYSADAESSLYMFIWMIVCIMLFSCVNGRLDQFIDVISEL